VKRRIKQLVENRLASLVVVSPAIEKVEPLTDELLNEILADIEAKNFQTYQQIADDLGCCSGKVRREALKEPGVLRMSKPHRVPKCVVRHLLKRVLQPKAA
jgi:hypothetical protein